MSRAIRKDDLAEVVRVCAWFVDDRATDYPSLWEGDKLYNRPTNQRIRARAAELREAIKKMLGHDKETRKPRNPQEIRVEPAPEPDGQLVLTATSLWSNSITEGGYLV